VRLGYVVVESAKRGEWERFAAVLGLGISEESDGETLLLRVDEQRHRLVVHAGPVERVEAVGWDAGSDTTLREILARIEQRGIQVEEGSAELHERRKVQTLYGFTDIDGFRMELFANPRVRTDPFFSASPMEAGFVTGEQGMGHVVTASRDLAASRRFYVDALGFRLSDAIVEGRITMDFLRCNPRHHSLGLRARQSAPGLEHLMLEVEELDDLGRAYDRVLASGLHVATTLGRHNVDNVMSFYVRSPSGFNVELGWGGRTVRDEMTWTAKIFDGASAWGHQHPQRRS
jgi:2,3-dihydroxybiphenyl 1,2-dioxygenase